MSFINYSSREINCKIVYCGPGISGKSTNLRYLYDTTSPELKGKIVSLGPETERTLFFDFLRPSLGEIRGFRARFHLYTVSGEVVSDANYTLTLQGVDGIVFVVDSQVERMEANVRSLDNLRANLSQQGNDPDKFPLCVQFNKRDLSSAAPFGDLAGRLNPVGAPQFKAIATEGVGVLESFTSVARLVFERLG